MKLPITKRQENDSRALSPFEQSLVNLQNTINRLFDDTWFGFPALRDRNIPGSFLGDWWPKADVSETDKEIKIKLNLPNVDPDKINIEVDSDSLIVSGQTVKEEEKKDENYIRVEREEGSFQRAFALPNGCDVENIKAQSKHGTLFIIIPKKPEAQKKKITVEVDN